MIRCVKQLLTAAVFAVSTAASQGYYPLEVGNRWDFGELDMGHFTFVYSERIIGDTLMPNGHHYAIRSVGCCDDYLRQSGDTVFSYWNGIDRLLYNFAAANGDTINVEYSPGDTTVTIVYTGQGLVFNTVRKLWTYYSLPRHSTGWGSETIADSVGPSHLSGEPGYYWYLIGAIINGTQYGTINGVRMRTEARPGAFQLTQNYPNPFNPSTVISFEVPTDSHVKVVVYDMIGREVATLVNEMEQAGVYTALFDGSKLASGVYFCRMEAQSANGAAFTAVRKLLLIR